MTDEAVQPALERLLEVIGESANALSEAARLTIADADWGDIRRLRILLAHHYHRIDPDQVWSIAIRDVPALAASILGVRPDLQF